MSLVEQYGVYQNNGTKNVWSGRKAKETGREQGSDRTRRAAGREAADKTGRNGKIALSDKAKALLEELQKKYQNMDFIVADYDSEEEARDYLSHGVKEYSVLIDPETLEEMANDEETKQKYLGVIDEATGKLSQMQEQLGEDGEEVTRVGVVIGKDGSVSYFAELEKMSERQKERIQAAREEKRSEQQEEKRAARDKRKEERMRGDSSGDSVRRDQRQRFPDAAKRTTVEADSVEELMEQIRSVDWEKINAEEFRHTGARLDFSI